MKRIRDGMILDLLNSALGIMLYFEKAAGYT